MSDRLTALLVRLSPALAPLARLLLVAAVLVPVWVGFNHTIISHPRLEWAVTNWYRMPGQVGICEGCGPRYGFTMVLRNEGNATTGEVHIELPYEPEFLDMIGNWVEAPERDDIEDPQNIGLGPMGPGDRFRLDVYGFLAPVTVLEDGEPVEETEVTLEAFFETKAWFPDWALLTGGLLLAGLAAQNLSMRRREPTQQLAT